MRPLRILRDVAAIPAHHRRLTADMAAAHASAGAPTPPAFERLAYGPHRRQYVLYAGQVDPRAPVAFWIHGGGWQFGSPELLAAFGAYFHARGYAVCLPSHRRLPRYGGAAIFADVLAGLATAAGVSPRRPHYLLGGVSSGGHLAALAALRHGNWRQHGEVGGLLCCGAPLSLRHIGANPTRFRLAGSPAGAAFANMDPVAQLTERPRFPAVIVHGDRDGLVPYHSSLDFVSRARGIGWDVDFHSLPGGGHLDSVEWVYRRR